jgi:hypothetical protein
MVAATAMNGHNWFFVRDNPRNARTTGSVKLVDAAVASACAPTYFDHWKIDAVGGQTLNFFDGGVGGTANPVYEACVEAFEFDAFTGADTRVIRVPTSRRPGCWESFPGPPPPWSIPPKTGPAKPWTASGPAS